jgi:hypothetical protein
MKRVPLVKLRFDKMSQTALVTYANKHRLAVAVAPGLTNYPDLPVPAAALATLITDFRLSLAEAYKGTKTQTATKNQAKTVLSNALRQNWNYVNQIVIQYSGIFPQYSEAAAFAATSGFDVQTNSTPAGPLDAPMIRSITSPAPGQMKIILNKFSKSGKQRTKKIVGAAVYEINYRTSAAGVTPAGPWQKAVSSAYFWQVSGLAAGSYDVYITAKGANTQQTAPTVTRQVTVI